MKHKRRSKAYIGIGSNLGDRKLNIEKAIKLIDLLGETKLEKASSMYETEPAECSNQGKFLNGVLEISTSLDPQKLLDALKAIEKHLGRKNKGDYLPRTIDLDILTFGKEKIKTSTLQIPHPRMHKREFVLKGIRELKNGKIDL